MNKIKIKKINKFTFVFQEEFLETNAGIIVTTDGAVIIDTLYRPKSARQVRDYLQKNEVKLILVVFTHGHPTHIYGCEAFSDQCFVLAHKLCKAYIQKNFLKDWKEWKKRDPLLKRVKPVLPAITFEGTLQLNIGGVELMFLETPGHSKDSIVVFLPQDRILFAGDTVIMPDDIPFFEENQSLIAINSLKKLLKLDPRYVIPGHGRIADKKGITDNIFYISQLRKLVKANLGKTEGNFGKKIPLEKCVREKFSPFWPELHEWNVIKVYNEFVKHPW